MLERCSVFLCLTLVFLVGCQSLPENRFPRPTRWADDMAKFREQDSETPPVPGSIVFVGSSSIRLWDLDASFPELGAVNRGFGGSDVEDSVYYFDDLITPHAPSVILLYAGDNDINRGKTPQRVFTDYLAFVERVRMDFPETHVIFIAIKPSMARWDKVGDMRHANALVRNHTYRDPRLHYVDIDTPMIGLDGQPRGELFDEDNLHLNDAGYELWTSLVRTKLDQIAEEGNGFNP